MPIKHGRYAKVPRDEVAEAMERQRAAEMPTQILDELARAASWKSLSAK